MTDDNDFSFLVPRSIFPSCHPEESRGIGTTRDLKPLITQGRATKPKTTALNERKSCPFVAHRANKTSRFEISRLRTRGDKKKKTLDNKKLDACRKVRSIYK